MRIRWKDFELPTRVSLDRESARPEYGKFVVEPFERGFGTTIGNGLRRVLLSSIEGTAVTAVRIEGVSHEFSTLPGVLEDVTDILLAVKRLRIRMQGEGPVNLSLAKKGKGIVTAADVQCPAGTEIVNPDLALATLTDDVSFQATLSARRGRGYVTSEENAPEEQEIGLIPVDSIFSPVYRVKYAVEATRVAKRTDYDRLLLEIWTDGTVSPEMALVEAAKIYRKHLNPFVQSAEAREQTLLAEGLESLARRAGDQARQLESLLDGSIEALEFSARAKKALEEAKLATVRDLASKSEEELAAAGLGPTVIREVEAKLKEKGLTLGAAAH
ncbi:MAG TPA: DNA-directed RNA polymerase subunit alpha [Planctomycetota bacterium]|jgi:DNA-directed RNA polymerase subunit alpha|nr:DNA-directed RNA polymerase subunit alpha [Planctomycetota bacterium]